MEKIDREKNMEAAWRKVRGLRGGRKEAGKSIVYEGRKCTSDKAKANAFTSSRATECQRATRRPERGTWIPSGKF